MFQALVQGRAAAVVLLASSSVFSLPDAAATTESGSSPKVVANDDRRPAGRLEVGTLSCRFAPAADRGSRRDRTVLGSQSRRSAKMRLRCRFPHR